MLGLIDSQSSLLLTISLPQDKRHGWPGGIQECAATGLPGHRRGVHRLQHHEQGQLREHHEPRWLVSGEEATHEQGQGRQKLVFNERYVIINFCSMNNNRK